MDRRTALQLLAGGFCSSAANTVQAQMPELIAPPVLKAGDTVGLIAPSTLVADPADIEKALRTVEYFDLKPKLGQSVGRRYGTHTESVDIRLTDLHTMFRDPAVRAVFAVSGGYGAAHLLDAIDYSLIRANPKIFLGYSDITALHLAFQKKAGLVTFHGPVLLSGFSDYTVKWFRAALFDPKPLGVMTNPPEQNQLRPRHPIRTIAAGRAEGRLCGGNLTLIATTMGTPYEIETQDRLMLLEDIGEQPYSVDRMLTQLRLAGKLSAAAGIVLGECNDCGPRDFKPSRASVYSYDEVVDNLLRPLGKPVMSGLTFGHTADQLTIPLGVRARVDAAKGTLEILESGTAKR